MLNELRELKALEKNLISIYKSSYEGKFYKSKFTGSLCSLDKPNSLNSLEFSSVNNYNSLSQIPNSQGRNIKTLNKLSSFATPKANQNGYVGSLNELDFEEETGELIQGNFSQRKMNTQEYSKPIPNRSVSLVLSTKNKGENLDEKLIQKNLSKLESRYDNNPPKLNMNESTYQEVTI